MTRQLISHNIVLKAKQVDPSQFGEYWLVDNGIFDVTELTGPRLCTELFAKAGNKTIDLVVTPDRIQIEAKTPHNDPESIVTATGKILVAAEAISLEAIGVNFVWEISLKDTNVAEFSKKMFLPENAPYKNALGGDNAAIGATFVRAVYGGVCRTQIMPAVFDVKQFDKANQMVCHFNYHFDMAGKSLPAAQKVLGQIPNIRSDAETLVSAVFENQS